MTNNHIIAKNTVILYVRMLISSLVSLYTSRVILQVLGVEDYGVYGVVGGIVGLFSFLNTSLSGATSRFLTFELERNNNERLKATFSSAMIVHIGIALVIFLLADSIGLWFLHNKLNIPEGRMNAANWALQCSIMGMFFTVTQVPYNATIISHEKMDVYAYVELLNVFLKLGIVYLLTIGTFDKLKLYAVLVLLVNIIIAFVYRIYCLRHYEECKFRWIWDKDTLKPLLSFSGWDLYGNMCVAARQQGLNFITNIFYGVILNAATGIASKVNGVILGLSRNVTMAFRPRIIKKYSQGDIISMNKLACSASKYAVLLYGCLMTPILLEMPYVMSLWLGNYPTYAVEFCRIMLFGGLIELINSILIICIHSTGNIKKISIITGSFFLLALPVAYFMLRVIPDPTVTYFVVIASNLVIVLSNLLIVKGLINDFNINRFSIETLKSILIMFVCSIIPIVLHIFMEESFMRLITVCVVNIALIAIGTFYNVLDKNERIKVKKTIINKLLIR